MMFDAFQEFVCADGEFAASDPFGSSREVVDPDAELVRLAQAGDQRAFEALVIKYRRRVTRHVNQFVRRAVDSEDLVQEIFIKAYRGLASFKAQSSFYTWLYRIARNAALNHVTRQSKLVILRDDLGCDDDGESFSQLDAYDDEDPERALMARQISDAVSLAVARLQPDLAEALLLYEVEGRSYKEIAQALQVPIGTVRTRIFRARDFIARRVEPVSSVPARRRVAQVGSAAWGR